MGQIGRYDRPCLSGRWILKALKFIFMIENKNAYSICFKIKYY